MKSMKDETTILKSKSVYFNSQRPEMQKYIPEDAMKILDVGCSDGSFCGSLIRPDREIWGIEMNATAAKKAEEVCNFVLVGDFNELYKQLPKNHFDCVIFNDVLEHIYSPWDTIKIVKTLLSSTGVLVSSIPNFRFIANLIEVVGHGEFKYRPEGGILDDTHIRFFTQKSIRYMFENQGYELLIQDGIGKRNDWKMKLLYILSFGSMKDASFRQFATVARPVKSEIF